MFQFFRCNVLHTRLPPDPRSYPKEYLLFHRHSFSIAATFFANKSLGRSKPRMRRTTKLLTRRSQFAYEEGKNAQPSFHWLTFFFLGPCLFFNMPSFFYFLLLLTDSPTILLSFSFSRIFFIISFFSGFYGCPLPTEESDGSSGRTLLKGWISKKSLSVEILPGPIEYWKEVKLGPPAPLRVWKKRKGRDCVLSAGKAARSDSFREKETLLNFVYANENKTFFLFYKFYIVLVTHYISFKGLHWILNVSPFRLGFAEQKPWSEVDPTITNF